jgi:hypothetical protein
VLARIRPRLTYANVVATLALFAALGGSSFAAVKLTSADIKNRSVKRVDLRKNTLTGAEIREARLRTVPRARSADSAQNAFTASNAQSADLAKNSENSQALAGQGAGAFERSSRVQFGTAPTSPAPAAGQEPSVVSWPELGISVGPAAAGGSCSDERIAVRSTRHAGSPQLVAYDDDEAPVLDPGETDYLCPATNQLEVTEREHPNRSLFVQCFEASNGENELKCLAVRSEP